MTQVKGKWSAAELRALRTRYPHEPTARLAGDLKRSRESVYNRAHSEGLRKTSEYLNGPEAHRLDGVIGTNTRFKRGSRPHNAGVKGWQAGGRSAETRFTKGHKPSTWVPIGTEVADRDGYLKRKIRDDAPPGLSRFNWKYVHVIVWETHNGRPRPAGHVVIFKDGNNRNFDPLNLDCISKVENMLRNTLHRYPREVVDTIRARGVLNRHINKRDRREEFDRRPA